MQKINSRPQQPQPTETPDEKYAPAAAGRRRVMGGWPSVGRIACPPGLAKRLNPWHRPENLPSRSARRYNWGGGRRPRPPPPRVFFGAAICNRRPPPPPDL